MVPIHDDGSSSAVRGAVLSNRPVLCGRSSIMLIVFTLITTQALLGAADNLWHHEITERLPAKRSAAGELVLHSVRELIYAFVFLGLGWFRWQGAWAALLAVVMLVEVVVTL